MNRRTAARLALAAAVLVGAAVMLLARDTIDPATLEETLRDVGSWAPAAFVGAFALATVVFVPGSLFGLAGGVLFGPAWGTFWNLSGGTLGAALAFLVARYVAGDWTAKLTGSRLRAIMAA